MNRAFISLVAALLLLIVPAAGQTAGGSDFGLGGSSVMWSSTPSTLFLNPAELSRIRQSEFSFNTFRLTGLSSFAGTMFFPSFGTLAAGVASYGPESQYSLAYSHDIGRLSGIGIAFTGFRGGEETFGFSLGGSLHLPTDGEFSGFHAGFSANNLSDNTNSPRFGVNFGVAYWAVANYIRVQGAFQHTIQKNYGLAGVELLPWNWMAVQVGTRSFNEVTGGIRVAFDYGSVELAGGKSGGMLTVNTSIGQLASSIRDEAISDADQAMDDEQFFEAADYYRSALKYDPYSVEAARGVDLAFSSVRTVTTGSLKAGRAAMEKKDFVEATRQFQRVLRINPENEEAQDRLAEMHSRIEDYVVQLVRTGDSLSRRREIEQARKTYERALELIPKIDSVTTRIANLKSLERSNVRATLTRARALLRRGHTDEAESAYQQVLQAEPRNTAARRGLEQVEARRNDELFETGKAAFDSSNYWHALDIFLDVLKNDDSHKDATDYLARTRKALLPQADGLFRTGLQFYTKDDYKAALEEWNKLLLIVPNHRATVEYRKRAEEKLKALERLK